MLIENNENVPGMRRAKPMRPWGPCQARGRGTGKYGKEIRRASAKKGERKS